MPSSTDDYRLEQASPTGGLLFTDPKEGEMLRRSLQYVIQRVSSRVLSGNVNFTGMSMPVHLNEPRSLLERLTDDWVYAPHFLPAAAKTTDPIRRIKLIAAFVISGLHCMDTLGKPFNPILGSTYHATLPDGVECHLEQTSHHPPVTHYTIRPDSGDYLLAGFSGISGNIEWGLDTGLSSRRVGVNIVQFADGTRIAYTLPRMLMRGLAAERKCEYLGPFSVFYEEYSLVFDFVLDPPQPFRWFRARVPSDYFDGVLYRLPAEAEPRDGAVMFTGAFKGTDEAFFGDPDAAAARAEEGGYTAVELRRDEEVVASVCAAVQRRDSGQGDNGKIGGELVAYARGTFLGYLDVDGERLWDVRETPKRGPIPGDLRYALASDCRFREDVIALAKANEEEDQVCQAELIDEAQLLKEKLENIQRNDRKLRAAGIEVETGECSEGAASEENVAKGEDAGNPGMLFNGKQEVNSPGEKSNGLLITPFFPKSLGR